VFASRSKQRAASLWKTEESKIKGLGRAFLYECEKKAIKACEKAE
jgi:hypothetical protein